MIRNIIFILVIKCFITYVMSSNHEPLFLTKFIESGRIKEGRKAALVDLSATNVSGIESYAGYFTVNETYNSNLFLWYFPAEVGSDKAPVVVWMNGGPGSSSLIGLFEENGPIYFDKDCTLKLRKYRWNRLFNMIFIDNPAGTGYSFTDSDDGYAKDQDQIGSQLLEAITQFYKLFPNLRSNKLFITGESYAGKYVPTMAYAIHNSNLKGKTKINLQGIAFGNGITDPQTMLNYADYFYQLGIIDSNTRDEFHKRQDDIVNQIKTKNFQAASESFQELILGGLYPHPTYFFNKTGFSLFYNFLHTCQYSKFGDTNTCVQKDKLRQSIHVGNLTFHNAAKVEKFLFEDIAKSVKPWFTTVLENYRTLVYSGQLDMIVPYPFTINFLNSVDWSGSEKYKAAERKEWWVEEELAGYTKTAGNLLEVLVRNAGHMVPTDQPKWAFDLINRFVFNKSSK